MAFEDDILKAGYSKEYLESLFDDVEDNYNRQREYEKKYVDEWKKNNHELNVIWRQYFKLISYFASFSDVHEPYEPYELKKWLNERNCFETERQKQNWGENIKKLFSLYQNELFEFYFPDDERLIKKSIVSKQACELSLLEFHEPALWKSVCLNNVIDSKFFEDIEWELFWIELYNREMDYEYWKDKNIEKYNLFAKQWIAGDESYVYGGWLRKHETERTEWKNKNMELWEKYKQNYEIREINKFILSKINEYNNKAMEDDDFDDEDNDIEDFDIEDFDIEDILAVKDNGIYSFGGLEPEFAVIETKPEPIFLPDKEVNAEIPMDINTLNQEVQKYIKEKMCSINFSQLSADASRYADEVLTQLWVFTNRDDWEMEELKKRHDYLFRNGKMYSKKLLNWWKKKYKSKWKAFITTNVPIFKRNLEIVLIFRTWAISGNKELFFSLADKYLPFWKKTIKIMYGYDINKEFGFYFGHNTLKYKEFLYEDLDYIKKHISKQNEIEIWQKELQDRVIWNVFYDNNYQEHYFIKEMYMSTNN